MTEWLLGGQNTQETLGIHFYPGQPDNMMMFSQLLGVVISHAAIVARENGLPAAVGIPEVTRRIRDGQRLRVDGAAGVVEILE
jgi:phosphoenolpyruvate-protein kinase (PTS system EI component)